MKYQGNIEDVKAIQAIMQSKKGICYVDKKTGNSGEFGTEPSSLYSIRLVLEDKSLQVKPRDNYLPVHGWLFFVSFTYCHRDNYAQMWVKDEDTGRMFKVIPEMVPLFGKLEAIILPEKEVNITKEHYTVGKILRGEGNGQIETVPTMMTRLIEKYKGEA